MLSIHLLILLSIINSLSASSCNLNVVLHQELHNEGFHRNMTYKVTFKDTSTSRLYEGCYMGLDQVLPPGVFASPDELEDLLRINKVTAIPRNRVNTELPAEESQPSSVFIIGEVKGGEVNTWLPVHARYHRAAIGGGLYHNKLAPPRVFARCPRRALDDCEPEMTQAKFPCSGTGKDTCVWKEIPTTLVSESTLVLSVPVGDLEHYDVVVSVTTAGVIVCTLYLMKTLHDYNRSQRGERGGRRAPRGAARVQAAPRVQRAGIDRWAGRGRGARRAGGARGRARRQSASGPRPRGRRLLGVRRAGLCPRAPGGGGEPRAARPRADATRSRSVPEPPPARAAPRRRRARSLARCAPPEPAPRLRPVFLWARHTDGAVQEVHCEDYDPRNRIRIARTPAGWRVIPRTRTFDAIVVPRVPAPAPRDRPDRRRRRRSRRRHRLPRLAAGPWPVPDLESHIPSHTIAIPRMLPTPPLLPASPPEPDPPPAPVPHAPAPPAPASHAIVPHAPASHAPVPHASAPHAPAPLASAPPALPEPTPMDNLLAVAELELELQSSALPVPPYSYRSEEQVPRDVMSFELPKVPDEIFFERKAHAPERAAEEDAFHGDMVSHEELFESISEAHYLPELGGHDEALLESLVEKGCEDNQILGQALDKLANLVSGAGQYVDGEEDLLLGGAPVTDIMDRLESLESTTTSSMTAAEGLLHLHHIGDHLPREHAQDPVDNFMTTEFVQQPDVDCPMETLGSPEMRKTGEVNHLEYEQGAEKRLQSNGEPANVLYTERVPDLNETYEKNEFESSQNTQISPKLEMPEVTLPSPMHTDDNSGRVEEEEIRQEVENDMELGDNEDKQDSIEDRKPIIEVLAKVNENPEAPKDLSIVYIEDDREPRDLTVHRRMGTPLPSPRRIEIPRAPSIESDAMQSPQPSGIPAISSPEVFQAPHSKNKTQSILDAMFTSSSPKMYLTSEVSITKQQCEPLNLGKHRKSASPTVSSCSEEKSTKTYGEPLEKRQKQSSMDELYQITRLLAEKKKKDEKLERSKKSEQSLSSMVSLKQFQSLKANKNFNIPDPLLIPKDRFAAIQAAPGKEIPALLVERPELRYYDDLDEERDPDIVVISVKDFEELLVTKEVTNRQHNSKFDQNNETERVSDTPTTPVQTESQVAKPASQPKPIPSMGALAEDIEAATSATLAPMLWAQYAQQQMEAVAACSQNAEFLKALNASGYGGANYSDLSQMLLNHPSRLMNPAGFPMMPHMDYERMQLVIWQEMMLQKMQTQRRKSTSTEAQMKEAAAKTSDFQSPFVHSTNKNYQSRSHSSARTSPITNNYPNQRAAAMGQHPFLQGMYPGMGAAVRPGMPMGGLNVPYFNPMGGSQRSPRTHHKSPTPPSPSYYANNNYLQSLKASEAAARAQHSPADAARPRISVKKVDELRRRRDDAEVGSTTPLGDPPLLPPDSSVPLWHPLFGNQKNYTSPWSWTTVTATGD